MSIMPEGGWSDVSPREKTDAQQSAQNPVLMRSSLTPSAEAPSHIKKLILPIGLLTSAFLWHIFLSLSLAVPALPVQKLPQISSVANDLRYTSGTRA